MSKMDDMRAMREANFNATPSRAATCAPAPSPVAPAQRTAPAKKSRPVATEAPAGVADDTRRCGHRAISGRSCTREHGHEEKSHRYG